VNAKLIKSQRSQLHCKSDGTAFRHVV